MVSSTISISVVLATTMLVCAYASVCPGRPNSDIAVTCSSDGYADAVDGEYLVTLCDEADFESVGPELEANCAVDVLHTYGGLGENKGGRGSVFYGFLVSAVDDDSLACLGEHEAVIGIECNLYVEAQGSQDVTGDPGLWGLDRIDQRSATLDNTYNYDEDGTSSNGQVIIYVFSTGINSSHPDFGGRAIPVFIASGLLGSPDPNENDPFLDCEGHGTHVSSIAAGTTAGVAKNAIIKGIKTLNCSRGGKVSDLIDSLEWLRGVERPSATAPGVLLFPFATSYSVALDESLLNIIALTGVSVVVAGGNQGSEGCNMSPGHLSRTAPVFTVGATDESDARWVSSNYGMCINMWAPGVGIKAAAHDSNGFAIRSGTSQAAAFVAGAVALAYEKLGPSATVEEIYQSIAASATTGVVTDGGDTYGQPAADRLLHTNITSGTVSQIVPCATCENWLLRPIVELERRFYPHAFGYEVMIENYHRLWAFGELNELDIDVFLARQLPNGTWSDVIRAGSFYENEAHIHKVYPGERIRWEVFAFDGNGQVSVYLDRWCDHLNNCTWPHGICIAPNLCRCHYEWAGSNCTEIPCFGKIEGDDPPPCSGNGECVGLDNCTCFPGFVGAECEFECDPATDCNGNGECDPLDGSCDCNAEFTGDACDEPVCDPPCLNGGVCYDGNGTNECNCTGTGFQGEQCNVAGGATTGSGTGGGGGPGGIGDPHFVGFKGQVFDFQGVRDQSYALISDAHFAMNARFVGYTDTSAESDYQTYMSQYGFLIGNSDRIFVACNRTVTLNGANVRKDSVHTLADGGSLTLKDELFGLHVPHYTISVMFKSHPRLPQGCFLNFHADFHDDRSRDRPHGVLGQTAHIRRDPAGRPIMVGQGFLGQRKQGGRVIEGNYLDYRVKSDDLFSPVFKYSRFVGAAENMDTFAKGKALNVLSSRGYSDPFEPVQDEY